MGSKLSLYQTFIFINDIHILSKKKNVMQVSDRRNAGDLVMQFYLHMLSIHNEFAEQKKYNKILYILKHKSLDKSKFDI